MYARPPSTKKEPQIIDNSNQILSAMQQRVNLTCFICSQIFNTTTRIPKIVCRRQHTYCAECVALIHKSRPMRCPQCRFKIYEENIFINRAVLSICQYFPTLRKDIDQKVEENNRLKKQNQELLIQIYKLKNQLARNQKREEYEDKEYKQKNRQTFVKQFQQKPKTPIKRDHTQKKEKTQFGMQDYEDKEENQKGRQSFVRYSQQKPYTQLKRGKINPELKIQPQKHVNTSSYQKRQLNPQLQIFNPLIVNYNKKK